MGPAVVEPGSPDVLLNIFSLLTTRQERHQLHYQQRRNQERTPLRDSTPPVLVAFVFVHILISLFLYSLFETTETHSKKGSGQKELTERRTPLLSLNLSSPRLFHQDWANPNPEELCNAFVESLFVYAQWMNENLTDQTNRFPPVTPHLFDQSVLSASVLIKPCLIKRKGPSRRFLMNSLTTRPL